MEPWVFTEMPALHQEPRALFSTGRATERDEPTFARDSGERAKEALWQRVDAIVERAHSLEQLRVHGVQLIAARNWRSSGQELPAELCSEERRAAMVTLAAPVALSRARAAYDGALVLMKGPEIAARYPERTMRPFIDLDLLADDVDAASRALLGCGFVEVGDPAKYRGLHHARPLAWPGLPLAIELHRDVNHPQWMSPPAKAALLELTQPSATGVAGLLAPVPAAHALLLCMHGWAHEPLRRLLDLIDIAVVLGEEDRRLADVLARRWEMTRVWRMTLEAVDSLLYGHGRALALRVWGRHLASVRERTVLETHIAGWAGPACGLQRDRIGALADATLGFAGAAHPRGDERWWEALARTRLAIADAFVSQSHHRRARELRGER